MQYKISFDMGNKFELISAIKKNVLPLMSQAVKAVAQQTAINWQQAVHESKLWSGEKDKYANSITWKMTSDWTAEISSDYQYAQDIESGRPARDLKKMLDYSLKVRQSKSGSRYLYIPFRHNTPSSSSSLAMPTQIYELAKTLTSSMVIGMGSRKSGTGAMNPKTKGHLMVPQAQYKWGDRLPAGLSGKMKPHHKTDIYAGMVKFNTSTSKAKSSAYLTFRTMSEKSQGWIVPAQSGQWILKKVVEDMQPKAQLAFKMAIHQTMTS